MINRNLFAGWGVWRALLSVPLLGLSACYLDEAGNPRRVDYTDRTMNAQQVVVVDNGEKKAKSSVKDPVQESTPGPKHVAAPKLPVIQ
jgi:hypothetical protein